MQVKVFKAFPDRATVWIFGLEPNLKSLSFRPYINKPPQKATITANRIVIGKRSLFQKDLVAGGSWRAYTSESECRIGYKKALEWVNKAIQKEGIRRKTVAKAITLKNEKVIAKMENRIEEIKTNPK